jgi:phosphoglucosamine mutase
MVRYPQVLVNVKVREKKPLEALPEVQSLITKVERQLGAEGRVLVRYSGTEAKVRVMVEGPTEDAVRAYAEEIGHSLERACGS